MYTPAHDTTLHTFHDPVLVTNLREFVLARRGPTGQAEEIMRYSLAASEAAFWQTSIDELGRRHGGNGGGS